MLSRVRQQQVTLVLTAPEWMSQPWYPVLLGMLIDCPVLLPQRRNTICPTHPGVLTRSDATTSPVAYLRRHYQDKEILEDSTELLLILWRQKSSQLYDSLLVLEFAKDFALHQSKLDQTTVVTHKIYTEDHPSTKQQPRRVHLHFNTKYGS